MFGRIIAERAYNELASLRKQGPVSQDAWLDTVERVANEILSPSAPPAKITRAERDLLFEAFAEVCRYSLAEITQPKAKEITTAIGLIRSKAPGLTPDEIRRRSKKFREKHPSWELTPTSLSKWWAELGSPVSVDTYKEPDADWRQALRKIEPGLADEFYCRPWADVRASYGRRIWQSLA
jgi:hypothetical protein